MEAVNSHGFIKSLPLVCRALWSRRVLDLSRCQRHHGTGVHGTGESMWASEGGYFLCDLGKLLFLSPLSFSFLSGKMKLTIFALLDCCDD